MKRKGFSLALVYLLPFFLYLIGTGFIARFGDSWYPLLYTALVFVLLAVQMWLLRGTQVFKAHWNILPGVLVGTAGIVMWVLVSELHIEQSVLAYLPEYFTPSERVGFNPFSQLSVSAAWAFVAARIVGIAIIVPLAEELFWRGFLLRWLIDPEWEKVPVGEFTGTSCLVVTFMFSAAHPELLAAALYCLAINALLYWKRDLWQCIVAHAVSNFLLVVYVIAFEAWWLW